MANRRFVAFKMLVQYLLWMGQLFQVKDNLESHGPFLAPVKISLDWLLTKAMQLRLRAKGPTATTNRVTRPLLT